MNNDIEMNVASGDQDMDSSKESIPVEALLYSYYIKYDKLEELTNQAFAGSDSDRLNVFIDFYQMLRSLYDRPLTGEYNIYTSAVLNLAAHIRAFYESRYQTSTKIYIVFSTNTTPVIPIGTPEWNDTAISAFNPQRDKMIGWNIKMLRMLCPYFPDVYIIEGTVDPTIMIYNRIIKNHQEGNKDPSIIITKDIFAWQIPTCVSETYVFRPRKTRAGDTSFCVGSNNVYYTYRTEVTKGKFAVEQFLRPEMYSLFLALTSYKRKGLSAYFTPSAAVKLIQDMISNNQILPGYNYPLSIAQALVSISKPVQMGTNGKEVYKNNLYNRYTVVDIPFLEDSYSRKPEANIPVNSVQKYDTRGIEEINDEFFSKNPINFLKLY